MKYVIAVMMLLLFGVATMAQDGAQVVPFGSVVVAADTVSLPGWIVNLLVIGVVLILLVAFIALGASAPASLVVRLANQYVASTKETGDDEIWNGLKDMFSLRRFEDGTLELQPKSQAAPVLHVKGADDGARG